MCLVVTTAYICLKCIFSMYYICCMYTYILPILLLCPAAGAREMLLWRRDVQGGGPVGQAGGLARKAPLGRHTLENKQELASNEECTRTCY